MWLALWGTAFGADPAEDLYQRCVTSQRAGAWQEAADACRACVEADRNGARAGSCADRSSWLEARRDEDGGWASLKSLAAAQQDDADTLDLEMLLVSNRIVQAEGVIALMHRQLDRLDVRAALVASEPWMDHLDGLPLDVRRKLVAGRAEALARSGEKDEALSLASAHESLGGAYAETLTVWRTADDIAAVSQVILVLFAAIGLPLAGLGWSRAPRPVPAGAAPVTVWGLGAAAVVAWVFPAPWSVMVQFVGGLLLIHLAASGGLRYLRRPWLVWPFRVATFAATVAVGYLCWYKLQFA